MNAELKLLITGPVGAGKTTALDALTHGDAVRTDVAASDDVALMKSSTTVAMDYGALQLDEETTLHVYGTPGQRRFDFIWPVLARGALGIIYLVDAAAPEPADELANYLDAFSQDRSDSPAVIGVTRSDLLSAREVEGLLDGLSDVAAGIPVMTVDARERPQLLMLVETLLCQLEATEDE